jgi:hypothetical protein
MSTERNVIRTPESNDISTTSFSGGTRGRCIQLTQAKTGHADNEHLYGYVQLDRNQAIAMIAELSEWLMEDISDVRMFPSEDS